MFHSHERGACDGVFMTLMNFSFDPLYLHFYRSNEIRNRIYRLRMVYCAKISSVIVVGYLGCTYLQFAPLNWRHLNRFSETVETLVHPCNLARSKVGHAAVINLFVY